MNNIKKIVCFSIAHLAVFGLFQFIYFAVKPEGDSSSLIYGIATGMSFINLIVLFLLFIFMDQHRHLPLMFVSYVFTFIIILTSAILLCTDATIKTSLIILVVEIFAYVILGAALLGSTSTKEDTATIHTQF